VGAPRGHRLRGPKAVGPPTPMVRQPDGKPAGGTFPGTSLGVPLGGGVITVLGPRWGLGLEVGIDDPIFCSRSSIVRLCLVLGSDCEVESQHVAMS